ncbi:MAG TPA: hypothetical protein VIF62_23080 [Labilithrix sp.]
MQLRFVAAMLATCMAACTATVGTTPSDGTTTPPGVDPPTTPPGDAPPPGAGSHPAFVPDIGQLMNQGGAILKAPKIVTIVWTADPNHAMYESLADRIGSSMLWHTALAEYGVGAAASGGHVEITTPPPVSMDDGDNDEVDAFVVAGLQGAPGNGWPVPDGNTMYMVYLPQATKLLFNGADDCPNNDGYHAETSGDVPYGLIATACVDPGSTAIDTATATAVHEMAETATDPHVDSDLAWTGFDPDHYAWEIFQQREDEDGDLCEFYDDAYAPDAQLGVAVQLLWSNASARAGHNPCVPAPSVPYFNVTALAQDFVDVTGPGGAKHHAKGFQIPVGGEKTFAIGFYSDAQTEDWNVAAVEGNGFDSPSQHLTATLDVTKGNDGTKANVTVKVTAAPAKGTQLLMTLISSHATGAAHYYPVLIGAY